MAAYDPTHVKVGPGTLYVAPLSTTEPTSVTGAWPAGWVELGYTDTGSEWSIKPTVQDVEVEEEYWPVDEKITKYEGMATFAMAETTQQNWLIAMNAGTSIADAVTAGIAGTNGDGSVWAEMPAVGSETRIMLGWDALQSNAGVSNADPYGRVIFRKVFQSGDVKFSRAKGSKKSVFAVQFKVMKPTGVNPFRYIFEPNEQF